jgi:hypothetical protein
MYAKFNGGMLVSFELSKAARNFSGISRVSGIFQELP